MKNDGKPGEACFASTASWYHNTATKKCEPFVYKGCRGNHNRFNTEELCKRTCFNKPLNELEKLMEKSKGKKGGKNEQPRKLVPPPPKKLKL